MYNCEVMYGMYGAVSPGTGESGLSARYFKSEVNTVCSITEKLRTALGGRSVKIIGHPRPDFDSVAAGILMNDLLRAKGIDSAFVIPDREDEYAHRYMPEAGYETGDFYGSIAPSDCLFLVDHHETLFGNTVLGCVDHHPSTRSFDYPVYINSPSSSCALTVFRLLEEERIIPDRRQTHLALMSVYMDTLSLKSPKFVSSDAEWIRCVTEKYSFDTEKMNLAGYCMTDMKKSISELAYSGFKEYVFRGKRVCTSHINAVSCEDVQEKLALAEKFLTGERTQRGAELWVLIYTDPDASITELRRISSVGTDYERYNRILSRSIDIMPVIEAEFYKNC